MHLNATLLHCLFLASTVSIGSIGLAQDGQVVMDGSFSDWADAPVLVEDPQDAPGAFVDLGTVRVIDDQEFINLQLGVGRQVNAQKLDGTIQVILNVDGSTRSGTTLHALEGVDLVIELTPQEGDRAGMGCSVITFDRKDRPRRRSPYDIDMVLAPTTASDWFEIRFRRTNLTDSVKTIRPRAKMTGRVIAVDRNQRIVDQTDQFTHEVTMSGARRRANPELTRRDPLERSKEADTRVVSWNAERGAFIENPAPFARMLRALEPDVIAIQELPGDCTPQILESWFKKYMGTDDWTATVCRGNLRTAVVSRKPFTPIQELADLSRPTTRGSIPVRCAGGLVQTGGTPILLASIHLKCCGSVGSREDEVRELETDLIRKAVGQLLKKHPDASIVIAGDYNLVGGEHVLQQMIHELDTDGSDLQVADLYQVGGRTNATWADRGQPFVPGRLDYIVFGDDRLGLEGGLVVDVANMPSSLSKKHKLDSLRTKAPSDHFPIVLDLDTSRDDPS